MTAKMFVKVSIPHCLALSCQVQGAFGWRFRGELAFFTFRRFSGAEGKYVWVTEIWSCGIKFFDEFQSSSLGTIRSMLVANSALEESLNSRSTAKYDPDLAGWLISACSSQRDLSLRFSVPSDLLVTERRTTTLSRRSGRPCVAVLV